MRDSISSLLLVWWALTVAGMLALSACPPMHRVVRGGPGGYMLSDGSMIVSSR